MKRKLVTGYDLLIFSIVFVFSIVFMFLFLSSDSGEKVVISVEQQVIGEYSLGFDITEEIKTKHGSNTLVISNGECFVVAADCRDGICINRGKISKIGESIVCLPHKLIVEIK